MKDTYQTITGESIGEFKDRGSKFIAYAYPVFSEEEWQEHLSEVKKMHPKGRHHCFAWRLGLDGNNFRANDDGEPSSSAGRPILGQVDSFGLTNVFIVVVRYWGGTKLGVPGLINAYKTATAEALSQAIIIEKTVEDIYRIEFDYAYMSDVMNAIKKLNIEMTAQNFGNEASVEIAIRQSEVAPTLLQLKAFISKIHIEEAEEADFPEGLVVAYRYTR